MVTAPVPCFRKPEDPVPSPRAALTRTGSTGTVVAAAPYRGDDRPRTPTRGEAGAARPAPPGKSGAAGRRHLVAAARTS